MAPLSKTLVLTGAVFAAFSSAVPIQQRDVVWETVTNVVWTTVDVTTTIGGDQPTTAPVAVPETTSADPAPAPSETTSVSSAPAPAPTTTSETAPTQAAPAPQVVSSSSSTSSVSAPATTAPAPETSVPSTTSAPAPTTTYAPAPSSSSSSSSSSTSAPAPTSSASSSSSSSSSGLCSESSPCSGEGTYYDTATSSLNPSSCGTTNDGTSEDVLALPYGLMVDSDCGKSVTVSYRGKTAKATVVDKCMGCQGQSIDLSRHLFDQLASEIDGRLYGVQWWFN